MIRPFRVDAPFHPIFVHFTVALSGTSLAFDALAKIFTVESLAAAAWWTLAAATLLTSGTVVSGLISRLRLSMEEGTARRFLRAHMALGPITFGFLIAVSAWRATIWAGASLPSWTYLIAMAAVMLSITVQGYLGGELVYRFGAEVRGSYRRLPIEDEKEAPPTMPQSPT
jgi:uncharacterized membrane protein